MNISPTYTLLPGNRDTAVKTLYERYGKKLYGYAIAKWQLNEDDAWDLVYKTLYRVLETYSGYSFLSEEKFAAFVFTLFINYLRNFHRDRKKKFAETIPLDESHYVVPNETGRPPASVPMQLLHEMLERLEDWERMLLLLRSQDVPYAEVARLTGKPESQLKVYYMRLKKRLSQQLTEKITDLNTERHGKTG